MALLHAVLMLDWRTDKLRHTGEQGTGHIGCTLAPAVWDPPTLSTWHWLCNGAHLSYHYLLWALGIKLVLLESRAPLRVSGTRGDTSEMMPLRCVRVAASLCADAAVIVCG